MIKPEIIVWQIQEFSDSRKYRVSFIFNHTIYDLVITDPRWHTYLAQLPAGNYTSAEAIAQLNLTNYSPDGFRFTVSLSQPFIPPGCDRYFCFKLVAAVMNVTQIASCFKLKT